MNARKTCCQMRNKVVVGIFNVLDEKECGVPDSEMADHVLFDVTVPSEKPVLMFKYCPWCGVPIDRSKVDLNITDVEFKDDEGEEWKQNEDSSD